MSAAWAGTAHSHHGGSWILRVRKCRIDIFRGRSKRRVMLDSRRPPASLLPPFNPGGMDAPWMDRLAAGHAPDGVRRHPGLVGAEPAAPTLYRRHAAVGPRGGRG